MIDSVNETPHATTAPRGFAMFVALVRKIIGVPDYETYKQHMAATHPDCAIMTEREFAEDRLVNKYSKPGQRCC
jgi:uncharacterized short protein YbdD (DUF466 family)